MTGKGVDLCKFLWNHSIRDFMGATLNLRSKEGTEELPNQVYGLPVYWRKKKGRFRYGTDGKAWWYRGYPCHPTGNRGHKVPVQVHHLHSVTANTSKSNEIQGNFTLLMGYQSTEVKTGLFLSIYFRGARVGSYLNRNGWGRVSQWWRRGPSWGVVKITDGLSQVEINWIGTCASSLKCKQIMSLRSYQGGLHGGRLSKRSRSWFTGEEASAFWDFCT